MTERTPATPLLNDVFIDRWSPRSFSPTPLTDEEIATLFEAARWSPSWMNSQPWLFVWETDGPNRAAILESFMEFNRDWAAQAPMVGLVLARTELEDFMARTRDFDTGAATMALTLQATHMGLSVHLLGGIDLDAAYAAAGANRDTTEILCGFAIGQRGDKSALSEKLQEREAPSDRKPAAEIAYQGSLPVGY